MSAYEPGTVAVATVRGVPNVRIFRYTDIYGKTRWDSGELVDEAVVHADAQVTDVRPLVVLDLGEHDGARAVTYLKNLALESRDVFGQTPSPRGKLANFIADQIEAQTKPPRIPEPGLYGIVTARIGAGGPWKLARSEYGWVCLDDGTVLAWDSLDSPILVRDGIEESS